MASEENIQFCNSAKNLNSDSEYEWVPLSLTTVEYPKGNLTNYHKPPTFNFTFISKFL